MRRAKRSTDLHPELGLPEVRRLWQTEGLFSDHYLKARIRSNSWWPTDEETRPPWEFSKTLYEKRAFALQRFDNEMGVRQEFIDKILEKLGFAWSDNLRLPQTQQELEPDYLLYASEEENRSWKKICVSASSCLSKSLPTVSPSGLALFSPTAFVSDAQGKCRLDHVRESALAALSRVLSRVDDMGNPDGVLDR